MGLTTWEESKRPDATQETTLRAFCHATVFQGVASLALPMVIIHQVVHAAQAATKRLGRFTKWGPTVAGLILIPALPFAVDEPCEAAGAFEGEPASGSALRSIGGASLPAVAAGSSSAMGGSRRKA